MFFTILFGVVLKIAVCESVGQLFVAFIFEILKGGNALQLYDTSGENLLYTKLKYRAIKAKIPRAIIPRQRGVVHRQSILLTDSDCYSAP